MMAESVICCPPDSGEIIRAMQLALSPEFRARCRQNEAPFGDGTTSEKITEEILRFFRVCGTVPKKKFYDIGFEV